MTAIEQSTTREVMFILALDCITFTGVIEPSGLLEYVPRSMN